MKQGRIRTIRVDIESVAKGTAINPPTTEVRTFGAEMNPDDNAIQREADSNTGGQGTAEHGPRTGKCTFQTELHSNGTTGLDAGLLVLFQACGMALDALVLSPVTSIDSQKTITIDLWKDGLRERLTGAMGTYEITGEVGQRVMISWTFSGVYSNEADAAVPTQVPPTTVPMLAKAATMTIGAYTPLISRFGVNPNNPVEGRESIAAAQGIVHYYVGANRRFVLTMDPEQPTTAAYDIRGLWVAKTEAAFSLLLTDGTVNVTMAAPKVQHMAPQAGTRESKAIFEMTGQCNKDDGDDEFTITTAAAGA